MYTYKCIENERELTASPAVVAGTTVGSVVKKLRNNSYFVNVSKDVIKTLESANLSYGNYNNERKKVAIILGNDKNNIKVRNYYANSHNISNVSKVPMYAMESLVIDCTSEASIKDLASKELVNSKANCTVTSNDGVYVYGGVEKDTVRILDALEMDVLYALLYTYGVNDNNITGFLRAVIPEIDKNPDNYDLSVADKVLFHAMFVENLDLTTIMYYIMQANNVQAELIRKEDEICVTMPDYTKDLVIVNYDEEFDPLNILAYLKNKKRDFIEKVIVKLGFLIGKVSIVEDKLSVSRIGKTYQDNQEYLEFRDVELAIPTQVYNNTFTNFDGQMIYTAVMNGSTDLEVDNRNLANMKLAKSTEVEKNAWLVKHL